MRRMILLCGRKKTGKGMIYTAASKLCPNSGEFFFAKPIKDFCINALGLTYEQMYGTSDQRESLTEYRWGNVAPSIRDQYKKDPNEFLTARQVLQVVGTDIMRNHFDPNVWAKAGARAAVSSNFDTCFFTDTRMENEIISSHYVSKKNGFEEPVNIRLYRGTGLIDEHITERSLDCFDAVPTQRSLSQGVPSGFIQVSTRLWKKDNTKTDNLFHYLLDNNGTVDEVESNMKIILVESGVIDKSA